MSAATAFSLAALALVALAAALFAAGIRRAVQGLMAAARVRARNKPLSLVVTAFADHGRCFAVTLARPGPWRWRPLPAFRAGMSLGLRMPLSAGGTATRRYSLAAWQGRPARYELAIKREEGGLVSNWAGEALRRGRRAEVTVPAGGFCWPERQAGEIMLVAAGIGITPMRAMVHAWAAARRRGALTLVWSVRDTGDLLGYHREFEALARAQPLLKYIPVLTGGGSGWQGERGRVDAQRLLSWCRSSAPQGVWMCASAAMMDALRDALVLRGVGPGRIHQEAFGAPANDDDAAYVVTLEPGGRRLAFQGESSLLAMLHGAGEPLASDCRNGTCGACRMRLLSGSVRQVVVPEWPLAESELLACCCVPATDLTLAS